MGIGDGITTAAGVWLLNKEKERNQKHDEEFCGNCGLKEKIIAKCPGGNIVYCGKSLCRKCAKTCPKCKKVFCPQHMQKHKCK